MFIPAANSAGYAMEAQDNMNKNSKELTIS